MTPHRSGRGSGPPGSCLAFVAGSSRTALAVILNRPTPVFPFPWSALQWEVKVHLASRGSNRFPALLPEISDAGGIVMVAGEPTGNQDAADQRKST